MKHQYVSFQCLNCGDCCRDLIATTPGLTLGLYLLPNELGLFSEDYISPWVGLDNRIDDFGPGFIAAYQLKVDRCPHLQESNKCGIYSRRPLVCKAFPLKLPSFTRNTRPLISKGCRQICSHCEGSRTYKVLFSRREEEESYKKIVNYLTEVFHKYRWIRFYDLGTDLWQTQIPIMSTGWQPKVLSA
jgi:Fe-S-cluster containining protein